MTVHVTDLTTSLQIQNDYDIVIGILARKECPEYHDRLNACAHRKMFWFADIVGPFRDYPSKADAKAVLDFMKESGLTDETKKVLLHCKAGISRSTATAIALLIMQNYPIAEAFRIVNQMRPEMWPSKMLIGYYDEILNMNGKLAAYNAEWKKHAPVKRPWE